jgi:hypothetical protein
VELKVMSIAMQWLSKHIPAMTNTHATIKELLEAVFFMQSLPNLYDKDQGDQDRQLIQKSWPVVSHALLCMEAEESPSLGATTRQ